MTTEAEKRDARPGRTEAIERGEPSSPLAALRLLRRREFALFWVGNTISLIGMWMQNFAQGWVVTNLTASAFALGLVNFASSIPTLALMPYGGVIADARERRRILLWTQWAMMILALVMGVLVATHRLQLWHIYILALLMGCIIAFDLPAYQAFYPELVEQEELPQAIALNQAAFHGSRIIGPAVAGVVVKLWGMATAFFANAASFLAVLLALALIRPRPRPGSAHQTSPWEMMKEGFRYVRERPRLQALLGITGITSFCIFPNMAVLTPFYAQHVLHVGADGLGTIMSMSGMGALVGAVLLLTASTAQRLTRIALAAVTILATMSVLAWSRHLWLSAGAVALQSMAISTSLGLTSIMVQEMVADEVRGRVMSLYSLMFTGVIPFAGLFITRIVDSIGMRPELQMAGVLYSAGVVFLLWRLSYGYE
jgi:MFS family permease